MLKFFQVSNQSQRLHENRFSEHNQQTNQINSQNPLHVHPLGLPQTTTVAALEGSQCNTLSLSEERKRRVAHFRRRSFIGKTCLSVGNEVKISLLSFVGLFIPAIAFILYEIQYIHGLRSILSCDIDLWLIIVLLNSGACFCFFVTCSLSDPGFLTIPLKQEDRKALPIVQKKGTKEYFLNYCVTCKIYRPIRTHHCKICDLCVTERDHHCPFLNNCIGRRNRRSYTYFLITAVLEQILIIAESLCQLLIPFIVKHPSSFLSQLQRVPFLLAAVLLLYAGLLGINILNLLIFQMKLIKRNLTTDEFRRLLGPQKVDQDTELNALFDRGCFRNFLGILCCFGIFSPPKEPIYTKFEPLTYEYRFKWFLHNKRKEMFQFENNQDEPRKNPFENEDIEENLQKDNEDEERELVEAADNISPPHSPNQTIQIVGLLQTKPSFSPSRFGPPNKLSQQRFFPRQMLSLQSADQPPSEDPIVDDALPSPQSIKQPSKKAIQQRIQKKVSEMNLQGLDNSSTHSSELLFSHHRLQHATHLSSKRRFSYDPTYPEDAHNNNNHSSSPQNQQDIWGTKTPSHSVILQHEALHRALTTPIFDNQDNQTDQEYYLHHEPYAQRNDQPKQNDFPKNESTIIMKSSLKNQISRQLSGFSDSDFNSRVIIYDIQPFGAASNDNQKKKNNTSQIHEESDEGDTPQKGNTTTKNLRRSIYCSERRNQAEQNDVNQDKSSDNIVTNNNSSANFKLKKQENNNNKNYQEKATEDITTEMPKHGSFLTRSNPHYHHHHHNHISQQQSNGSPDKNNQILSLKSPQLGLIRFQTNSTSYSNPRIPAAPSYPSENIAAKNSSYLCKLSRGSSLFDRVQEQSTTADGQTPKNFHFSHRSNSHSHSIYNVANNVINQANLASPYPNNEQDDFNNPKPECDQRKDLPIAAPVAATTTITKQQNLALISKKTKKFFDMLLQRKSTQNETETQPNINSNHQKLSKHEKRLKIYKHNIPGLSTENFLNKRQGEATTSENYNKNINGIQRRKNHKFILETTLHKHQESESNQRI